MTAVRPEEAAAPVAGGGQEEPPHRGVAPTRRISEHGAQVDAGAVHAVHGHALDLAEGASDVTSPDGLAGLGGAAPEDLYITQARNGALILSSRVNGAQPRNYIIGGENPLPAPGGEAARMTMSSRWQGLILVNEGSGEVEGDPLVVREVMSLSRDGRTLRLEVTTTLAGAGSTNTLIYRKAGS